MFIFLKRSCSANGKGSVLLYITILLDNILNNNLTVPKGISISIRAIIPKVVISFLISKIQQN